MSDHAVVDRDADRTPSENVGVPSRRNAIRTELKREKKSRAERVAGATALLSNRPVLSPARLDPARGGVRGHRGLVLPLPFPPLLPLLPPPLPEPRPVFPFLPPALALPP